MRLRSREPSSERGAAIVEFALILPILIAILGGIIDFGLAFNAQIGLAHAAREGARYEALGLGAPGDGATVARTAYVATGNGTIYTSVVSCPNVAGQASVTISQDYEFVLLPFDPNLSSEAVMRCGG